MGRRALPPDRAASPATVGSTWCDPSGLRARRGRAVGRRLGQGGKSCGGPALPATRARLGAAGRRGRHPAERHPRRRGDVGRDRAGLHVWRRVYGRVTHRARRQAAAGRRGRSPAGRRAPPRGQSRSTPGAAARPRPGSRGSRHPARLRGPTGSPTRARRQAAWRADAPSPGHGCLRRSAPSPPGTAARASARGRAGSPTRARRHTAAGRRTRHPGTAARGGPTRSRPAGRRARRGEADALPHPVSGRLRGRDAAARSSSTPVRGNHQPTRPPRRAAPTVAAWWDRSHVALPRPATTWARRAGRSTPCGAERRRQARRRPR